MKDNWKYHRGDIYLIDLGTNLGSEQGGCRPALVLQNDVGNYYGPTLIVAPITSHFWKKPSQPTHYLINESKNLSSPSVVLTEQLITIDKMRVKRYLGRVPEEQMHGVNHALKISLALE